MKFDFISQRIVAQLDTFYDVTPLDEKGYPVNKKLYKDQVGSMFFYDFIYDHLEREGNKIDFPPDIKAELWRLAQEAFYLCEKRIAKDQQELHRYYKSYLACQYLLNKLPERMFVMDAETGKKITRIELRLKYEKLV